MMIVYNRMNVMMIVYNVMMMHHNVMHIRAMYTFVCQAMHLTVSFLVHKFACIRNPLSSTAQWYFYMINDHC